MKITLLHALVIAFLIIGISLFGNSLEVNAQTQALKKYENGEYGITFQYPSDWGEPSDLECHQTLGPCGPRFINLPSPSPAGRFFSYSFSISVIKLDDPAANAVNPCNCKTLKDFLVWDYARSQNLGNVFVNDNQTILGSNISAWQTETTSTEKTFKTLRLYAIRGNVGYIFTYLAPSDEGFGLHLSNIKNVLKSVTLKVPMPEKKPSFLNAADNGYNVFLSLPIVSN
jgi:hypothetical protein